MRPSARTRVFAVLGNPVAHSLSPAMHTAGFRAAGLDATYVALAPAESGLAAVMSTLVHGGGGGNVTIPFKRAAALVHGTRDSVVDVLGSANVFGGLPGGLHIGNTDVAGILAALDAMGAANTAWCVIGTGGSARAVAGAAAARGARLHVRSRDAYRAADFSAWCASIGAEPAAFEECGVIINATPLGLAGEDVSPLEPLRIGSGTVVLDLAYRHDGPTAWVKACTSRGLIAADGREVLLAQAVASWAYWFDDIAAPVEVMRAVLDGRVG